MMQLESVFKMPLADAIRYAERIPRDNGVRRFKFIDERAFVKFVSILRVIKMPAFKIETQANKYYIVHGEDDYGEVVAFFRGGRSESFVESAFKVLGITLKSCCVDRLLDLLKL